MKKLIIILLAVGALCMGALAYIAFYLSNTIVEERNRRQTEPARAARHAKKEVIQPQEDPAQTNASNEKEQVA